MKSNWLEAQSPGTRQIKVICAGSSRIQSDLQQACARPGQSQPLMFCWAGLAVQRSARWTRPTAIFHNHPDGHRHSCVPIVSKNSRFLLDLQISMRIEICKSKRNREFFDTIGTHEWRWPSGWLWKMAVGRVQRALLCTANPAQQNIRGWDWPGLAHACWRSD